MSTPTTLTTVWTGRPACAGRTDLPWLVDAEDISPADWGAMRAVCASCPVAIACNAAAVAVDATAGFWSGQHYDTSTPTTAPERAPVAVGWERHRPRPRRGRVHRVSALAWDQSVLVLAGMLG